MLSFSAPGLVLGLLLLSLAVEAAVAMRRCSGSSYMQLLGQLQSLAHLMKDTSCLLQPYVSISPLVASEPQRMARGHQGSEHRKDLAQAPLSMDSMGKLSP